MGGDNFIAEYLDGIRSGIYTVGRWVRLVYEYLETGLKEGRFYFDQEKAQDAIDWYENHCFHTEGDLAPGRIRLEVWQKAFVSAVFGIVDADGCRQFREVVLLVGRKNGKTKLASGAASYIWRKAGGYGARVFCVAPKLDQADLVYMDTWQMTTLDPEWQEFREEIQNSRDVHNARTMDDSMLARRRQSDLCIPGLNSTVKKIPFSARRSDGYNPLLVLADEVAAWPSEKGLKQYEVMKSEWEPVKSPCFCRPRLPDTSTMAYLTS